MDAYQKAGVDITSGDRFVEAIKGLAAQTGRPEVLEGLGGFAGLFQLKKYRQPVLAASTDGVGTKIVLAQRYQKWRAIGIDCVAMCINDVACLGAEPLFFLDYLACGRLEPHFKDILAGMAEACRQTGCALLGGETAEMPGVYPAGQFDVAGFAVGVVEKSELIDGKAIRPGDIAIGVASSGFHSNGFSLIRKILEDHKVSLEMPCAETGLTLAETLLLPTKLYSPLLLKLKKSVRLKGIAHITGGGLVENPPRILPKGCVWKLNEGSWPLPEYMQWFKKKAGLNMKEFLRVFNAGIGLVVVVAKSDQNKTLRAIAALGETAWVIGQIDGKT